MLRDLRELPLRKEREITKELNLVSRTYSLEELKLKDDRFILERIIFPYFLKNYDIKKVLDVGREGDQEKHNWIFRKTELWTVDVDPEREEWGSKNHIVASVADIEDHFESETFDLIILNGVFGWGLNNPEEIEKAFSAMYNCLKKGGHLIFGWNNNKDTVPMPVEEIQSLKKFKPYPFPPLQSEEYECSTGRHTFNFYTKC